MGQNGPRSQAPACERGLVASERRIDSMIHVNAEYAQLFNTSRLQIAVFFFVRFSRFNPIVGLKCFSVTIAGDV